jgi:hypothetical protein
MILKADRDRVAVGNKILRQREKFLAGISQCWQRFLQMPGVSFYFAKLQHGETE